MNDKIKTFIKSKDILNIGIKTILIIIVVSIILPLSVDKFIFGNNFRSNITNGEWASFLGSFLGGLIGGIGTLTAVLITVKEARNVQYKNARPILILEEYDLGKDCNIDHRFKIGIGDKTILYSVNIKNIGIGIASNIEVVMKFKKGDKAINLFKNPIAPDKGLLGIMFEKKDCFQGNNEINYNEPLEIHYEDLFGHKYLTKYKLNIYEHSDTYNVKIEEVIEVGKEML